MDTSMIVSVAFPIGIAFVMLGLGLALQVADFTRILKSPKPVLVGLFAQVALLPSFAYLLSIGLKVPMELAVGMIVLSAAPTGPTSNLFIRFANADIALGLTLTAIGSVVAAITLPLLSGLAIHHFSGSEAEIAFQFRKTLEVVLIVVGPVLAGMTIRANLPSLASRLDRPLRILSVLVLLGIIFSAVSKEWRTLTDNLGGIGWIIILFNAAALGGGYFFPKLFGLARSEATTIALGSGIRNAALSIYLALSVLGSTAYALPSAIFGVLMFFSATAFTFILRKTTQT